MPLEKVTIRVKPRLLLIECETREAAKVAATSLEFYCQLPQLINEGGYYYTQVGGTLCLQAPDRVAILLEIIAGIRRGDDIPSGLMFSSQGRLIDFGKEVYGAFQKTEKEYKVEFVVE